MGQKIKANGEEDTGGKKTHGNDKEKQNNKSWLWHILCRKCLQYRIIGRKVEGKMRVGKNGCNV